MFLSDGELSTLTGRLYFAKQCEWLRDHGWIHEVAQNGRPAVSRAYAEKKLGGAPASAVHNAIQIAEPNYPVAV